MVIVAIVRYHTASSSLSILWIRAKLPASYCFRFVSSVSTSSQLNVHTKTNIFVRFNTKDFL